MTTRTGINSFGQIGRLVFRSSADHPEVEAAGNDPFLDTEHIAYMLKHASVRGRLVKHMSAVDSAAAIPEAARGAGGLAV